jgi:hypothetical protein
MYTLPSQQLLVGHPTSNPAFQISTHDAVSIHQQPIHPLQLLRPICAHKKRQCANNRLEIWLQSEMQLPIPTWCTSEQKSRNACEQKFINSKTQYLIIWKSRYHSFIIAVVVAVVFIIYHHASFSYHFSPIIHDHHNHEYDNHSYDHVRQPTK